MPIPFTCETCGHSMNAPSKFAGKRVRCKQCNEFTPIPELEANDAPSYNPNVFDDDEPIIPKRSARRDADDLLGESPPPQEVLPKRIGVGDYGETGRRDRDRDGEAPVIGLPPIQVVWISAGILVVSDAIQLSQSMEGGKFLGAFMSLFFIQAIGLVIDTGVMAIAGKVVDIEPSSLLRLLSIALAQNVVNSVGGLIIVLAGGGPENLPVVLIVGLGILVLNLILVSRSLGLGCGGLIAFGVVKVAIYFVIGLVVRMATTGLQPQ